MRFSIPRIIFIVALVGGFIGVPIALKAYKMATDPKDLTIKIPREYERLSRGEVEMFMMNQYMQCWHTPELVKLPDKQPQCKKDFKKFKLDYRCLNLKTRRRYECDGYGNEIH